MSILQLLVVMLLPLLAFPVIKLGRLEHEIHRLGVSMLPADEGSGNRGARRTDGSGGNIPAMPDGHISRWDALPWELKMAVLRRQRIWNWIFSGLFLLTIILTLTAVWAADNLPAYHPVNRLEISHPLVLAVFASRAMFFAMVFTVTMATAWLWQRIAQGKDTDPMEAYEQYVAAQGAAGPGEAPGPRGAPGRDEDPSIRGTTPPAAQDGRGEAGKARGEPPSDTGDAPPSPEPAPREGGVPGGAAAPVAAGAEMSTGNGAGVGAEPGAPGGTRSTGRGKGAARRRRFIKARRRGAGGGPVGATVWGSFLGVAALILLGLSVWLLAAEWTGVPRGVFVAAGPRAAEGETVWRYVLPAPSGPATIGIISDHSLTLVAVRDAPRSLAAITHEGEPIWMGGELLPRGPITLGATSSVLFAAFEGPEPRVFSFAPSGGPTIKPSGPPAPELVTAEAFWVGPASDVSKGSSPSEDAGTGDLSASGRGWGRWEGTDGSYTVVSRFWGIPSVLGGPALVVDLYKGAPKGGWSAGVKAALAVLAGALGAWAVTHQVDERFFARLWARPRP